jgi:hypothetical protein
MALRISASRYTALGFLVAALLVGGILGLTADRLVGARLWGYGPSPADAGDIRTMRRHFDDELNLSPAQRIVVDSIAEGKRRTIDALMAPVRPHLDSLDDATAVQINALLTPEQRPRFERMHREFERMKAERRRG